MKIIEVSEKKAEKISSLAEEILMTCGKLKKGIDKLTRASGKLMSHIEGLSDEDDDDERMDDEGYDERMPRKKRRKTAMMDDDWDEDDIVIGERRYTKKML